MGNIETGRQGEDLASNYLLLRGYEILARNYSCEYGEIDIIASHKDLLAFVEVKTRRTRNYGHGFEAVNRSKQEKIFKTSLIYLQEENILNRQVRYDIIEVYLIDGLEINHIENAFIV